MTYVLPDEPRGAVRPELAVSTVWPLLALMLVGPFAGFVWLAFNSWALGSRHASRDTVAAIAAVPMIGLLVLAISALSPEDPDLTQRLMLIAVNAGALCLAFWIMMGQDDAEQWRRTFGPRIGNGAPLFFGLFALRLIAGSVVPPVVAPFVLWAAV